MDIPDVHYARAGGVAIAYQVVGEGWRQDGGAAGRLAGDLPADRDPSDSPLVAAPRLAELCFQVAGLWEAGTEGRLALPAHVDRLELVVQGADHADGGSDGVVAMAAPAEEPGVFD